MRFIEAVAGLESRLQLDLYKHRGQHFLIEVLPIEVACIPVSGNAPDQCVYVHPRYVPRGFGYKKRRLQGRIRGRCIEFLVGSEDTGEARMLSMKGTGANAGDQELVINPKQWWGSTNGLRPGWYGPGMARNDIDNTGRQWGAVRSYDGALELRRLRQHEKLLGMQYVNHSEPVAVPKKICREIQKVHACSFTPSLVQVPRILETNIRLSDLHLFRPGIQKELVDTRGLAGADAHIFHNAVLLSCLGNHCTYSGYIADNRFISGQYIDSENLDFQRVLPTKEFWLPTLVFSEHLRWLPQKMAFEYAKFFVSSYRQRLRDFEAEYESKGRIYRDMLGLLKDRSEVMSMIWSALRNTCVIA